MISYLFEDIVKKKDGFLRGPFGGALKKEIFVKKSDSTFKVYEQGVVLNKNNSIGNYYITKEYYDLIMHRFTAKENDILVSCSGVNYGAIYQLPTNSEIGVINQALLRIRLNNEIVDDKYFIYLFENLIVKRITGGTGDSTIPNFPPMNVVRKIPIELPSLLTQQKIAKVLSDLDAKIELNNKINAELEAMAKTLYDYWFVQFDFPDANGKPYKFSGGKMVWNDELKRDIPEGWGATKLENLGNFKNGVNYDPSNPGDIACPIINVRNISASSYFIKNSDLDIIYLRENDVRKYSVHKGSIIIARSGIPGATRLISDIEANTLYCGFAIHYELINLSNKLPIFFHLKSIEEMIKNGSGGTILKNVNQATLNNLIVAFPNNELIISKFNELVNPLFDKINLIEKENQELASLRDWLLPMLMNGQVSVGGYEVKEKATINND
jgi:type I restriction enzyme S subunit